MVVTPSTDQGNDLQTIDHHINNYSKDYSNGQAKKEEQYFIILQHSTTVSDKCFTHQKEHFKNFYCCWMYSIMFLTLLEYFRIDWWTISDCYVCFVVEHLTLFYVVMAASAASRRVLTTPTSPSNFVTNSLSNQHFLVTPHSAQY